MSYLSRWWEGASQQQRKDAKEVIGNGQLEIVTGGWVMNDEANTHVNAIISQLQTGHRWLERTLGVKPR